MHYETPPLIDAILGLIGLAALVWTLKKSRKIAENKTVLRIWVGIWCVVVLINVIVVFVSHDPIGIPWFVGSIGAICLLVYRKKHP